MMAKIAKAILCETNGHYICNANGETIALGIDAENPPQTLTVPEAPGGQERVFSNTHIWRDVPHGEIALVYQEQEADQKFE